MRLYHGGISNISKLKSASETGIIRSGEESRRGFLDVIFLTSNFNLASEYAGKTGSVYACDVKNSISYQGIELRKDIKNDIFIASSKDITIVMEYQKVSRRRGEKQKYNSNYRRVRKWKK